ncbi:MAG: hypothetical protein ABR985_14380 [Methanotrichaceae archaeon]
MGKKIIGLRSNRLAGVFLGGLGIFLGVFQGYLGIIPTFLCYIGILPTCVFWSSHTKPVLLQKITVKDIFFVTKLALFIMAQKLYVFETHMDTLKAFRNQQFSSIS